jgi:hypothetical protein
MCFFSTNLMLPTDGAHCVKSGRFGNWVTFHADLRSESVKTQNMEVKLWNESNIKLTSSNNVDMLMVDRHRMDLQYYTYELCVPFRFTS